MENLKQKIKSLGFLEPTKIQQESYKIIQRSESAIFISPTGTGKTHAYLIPIVECITSEDEVQALIVVPTNELVLQVGTMLKDMGFLEHKTFSTLEDRSRQIKSLKNKQPKIAISTPGRLYDLVIEANALKTHTAKHLVLDEADMLFDFDFVDQLDAVISKIKGATYIYSATLPKNLTSWIGKYFKTIHQVNVTDKVTLNIDHYLVFAKDEKKRRLFYLLETMNPYLCFIFVSKNEEIDSVYEEMIKEGYNVTKLSSKVPLRQRKNILDDIKQLKYQYVVCSDIASRGMDILGISHIIHYDMPYKLEFYIHRSGRTGRMNMHGSVYAFYDDKDSRKFENLRKRGVQFKECVIKNKQLIPKGKKEKQLSQEEINAIRSVKKPTRVTPGYKKKNKQKIKKALQTQKYKKGTKK